MVTAWAAARLRKHRHVRDDMTRALRDLQAVRNQLAVRATLRLIGLRDVLLERIAALRAEWETMHHPDAVRYMVAECAPNESLAQYVLSH